MLESIRARYLLDDDLTIAITADATARVFGAQVQPFNQRLVFRLVIRGVSNALSVLLKDCTGRVANDDPDGAWPWISTTTTIRIEANLPDKFIHGQRISFSGNPKHSSCDGLMDQERLPVPRSNVRECTTAIRRAYRDVVSVHFHAFAFFLSVVR